MIRVSSALMALGRSSDRRKIIEMIKMKLRKMIARLGKILRVNVPVLR
jgi:hypothetical protein